jgi:hypothetical protein
MFRSIFATIFCSMTKSNPDSSSRHTYKPTYPDRRSRHTYKPTYPDRRSRHTYKLTYPDRSSGHTYKPMVMTYGRPHTAQTHNERTSTESNLVTAQSTAHELPENGRKYGPKHVEATSLKCF